MTDASATNTGQSFIALCSQERQRIAAKARVQQPRSMSYEPSTQLPSGWIWASVSEVCERVSVGHVGPTTEHFCSEGEGIALVRSQNVRPGRLKIQECARITSRFHASLKKSQLREGDVLVVRVGANRGDVAFVPKGAPPLNCANIIFARPAIKTGYLQLYLRSNMGRDSLLAQTTGSAQGVINTESIAQLPIPVPPLAIQLRIAFILSAYDDLIENNARRITILEEMARRLYEEWFVQFRFPGHESSSLKETEVGLIPSHWSLVRLDQAVLFNPRTRVPVEGEKLFIPMTAVSENSMIIGPWEKKGGNSGAKFQNGDTIVARISPCLENGKTGFVCDLPPEQPTACGSTEFIVLRSAALCPEMVYLLARSNRFRDVAMKSMSGATGRQRVRSESLEELPIALPDGETLQRFRDVARPAFQQIALLARKNTNLRAQRDLLLPKLISGEIDVSQAPATEELAAE